MASGIYAFTLSNFLEETGICFEIAQGKLCSQKHKDPCSPPSCLITTPHTPNGKCSQRRTILRVYCQYLDPGCPTFFGLYPTNLWDITQKRKDIQGPGTTERVCRADFGTTSRDAPGNLRSLREGIPHRILSPQVSYSLNYFNGVIQPII